MDIDTASYGVMRRYLRDGNLPDPNSVRVEEYLNNFNYQYPQPEPGSNFTIYTESSPSPWGGTARPSTGSTTTVYMIHSTATQLLPFIEQVAVYNLFNHDANPIVAYGASPSGVNFLTPTGCLLHPKAKGLAYDDPNHKPGQVAAKTQIPSFICPSTPAGPAARDPQGYGVWDYMFIDLTDVDESTSSATFGERTQPTGTPAWSAQARSGMLTCDGGGFSRVTDGTSNTLLCIEDAGRAHPSVAMFGSLSSRKTPVSGAADPVPMASGGDGRRMYAWADADAVTNGFSGPSNAISPASKKAKINNNASPIGGPPECRWSVNNCGVNDEPFSFHVGGVNAVMGDGSVRYLSDSTDGIIVKWMVGANDGHIAPSE